MSDFEKLINASILRAESNRPKLTVATQAINEHLKSFVEDVSNDQRCKGLLVQLVMSCPHGANEYVISLNIASSNQDLEATKLALTRKPLGHECVIIPGEFPERSNTYAPTLK